MASKNLITIDTDIIALIEEDGDKFLLDPRAEDNLVKWQEFKERIEEVDDIVKARFSEAMLNMNCKKVEGETINVVSRFYGERFEVTDPQLALTQGYAKEVVSVKPEAKAISEYEKESGELPEGIKLRERVETISFLKVKEKGEKHGRE